MEWDDLSLGEWSDSQENQTTGESEDMEIDEDMETDEDMEIDEDTETDEDTEIDEDTETDEGEVEENYREMSLDDRYQNQFLAYMARSTAPSILPRKTADPLQKLTEEQQIEQIKQRSIAEHELEDDIRRVMSDLNHIKQIVRELPGVNPEDRRFQEFYEMLAFESIVASQP